MSAAKELGAMIAAARKIVALTGAGISAESGIPTFRGEGGLWGRFDPYVVASIDSFRRNPAPYWEFFKEVRTPALKSARPNRAHKALALLEEKKRLSSVITQNIDGLHQEAGSVRVIELHGNARRFYCMSCGVDYSLESVVELLAKQIPPCCTGCGGWLRPDVVFFGESLPAEALEEAAEECRSCDLMLVVGSSLLVHPAASLPLLAKESGARLAIVNKGETPLDEMADLKLGVFT